MSHYYTPFKTRVAQGLVNWAALDLRAEMLMTNTTADTDVDAANPADITTLDRYDGTGYTAQILAGEAVVEDLVNNRAELVVTDFSFGTNVQAGTRPAAGILIKEHVDGTDANDRNVMWVDSGGFPQNGLGGPYDVDVDAEGLGQVT